jgi:hypothetical protein
MVRGLAPFELQGYYRAVLKIGIDGLKGIEIIQAEQLKQFAIGIMEKNNEVAYNFFIANPEFRYPLEYLENPLEYWKINSSGHNEPETVIGIINDYLNQNKNLKPNEKSFLIGKVKEIRDVVINDSVEEKINHYKGHIRGALTDRPESKHREFFIEKLRDEIALLDGSFDLKHGLVNQPSEEKKKDENIETRSFESFEHYLTKEGKVVFDYLVKNYTNTKPEIIAFMLFALKSLNYLNAGSLTNNKTKLHKALENSFGKIGTRQSLTTNLIKLGSPDTYLSDQIGAHKKEIKKATKGKN